jgi:hypothetical protein
VTVYQWFGLKTTSMFSPGLALKPVAMVSSGLDLKIGSFSLVICASKSPSQILDFALKIKWDMVCQLCHKTNGMVKTVWDMHRDLATYFV